MANFLVVNNETDELHKFDTFDEVKKFLENTMLEMYSVYKTISIVALRQIKTEKERNSYFETNTTT